MGKESIIRELHKRGLSLEEVEAEQFQIARDTARSVGADVDKLTLFYKDDKLLLESEAILPILRKRRIVVSAVIGLEDGELVAENVRVNSKNPLVRSFTGRFIDKGLEEAGIRWKKRG